jgi:hypothetical protein
MINGINIKIKKYKKQAPTDLKMYNFFIKKYK